MERAVSAASDANDAPTQVQTPHAHVPRQPRRIHPRITSPRLLRRRTLRSLCKSSKRTRSSACRRPQVLRQGTPISHSVGAPLLLQ
ncbi:hypothetical protein JG687_00012762 [Phytophthora cactorum]|uniref:Uncharacterized protein n=1 Tax=Phytophthora cactorum TaxID=29920 RepID=A0A8T1U5H2_9STRA|nr:hypothetical protein JG687_00012762 [Phytophthora cactorum]